MVNTQLQTIEQIPLPLLLEPSLLPKEKRTVYLSNALARGSNGLSYKARKLVIAAIANSVTKKAQERKLAQEEAKKEIKKPVTLREKAQYADRGFAIRINALEYANDYGISRQAAYKQLAEAADDLMNSQWSVFIQMGKGNHTRQRKYNWVTYAEYAEGEGFVEIVFVAEIASHILSLDESFTHFLFSSFAKLKTEYAIALFQNLVSWQNTGAWECDIDVFHEVMGTPKSAQNDFSLLRKNIIEPSIKNIENELGWKIGYTTRRRGKGGKVIKLVFNFTQPQLIEKPEK